MNCFVFYVVVDGVWGGLIPGVGSCVVCLPFCDRVWESGRRGGSEQLASCKTLENPVLAGLESNF